MKINTEAILFHPLTILVLLFISFIIAGAPARAEDQYKVKWNVKKTIHM
jgi:hypothetical protein